MHFVKQVKVKSALHNAELQGLTNKEKIKRVTTTMKSSYGGSWSGLVTQDDSTVFFINPVGEDYGYFKYEGLDWVIFKNGC